MLILVSHVQGQRAVLSVPATGLCQAGERAEGHLSGAAAQWHLQWHQPSTGASTFTCLHSLLVQIHLHLLVLTTSRCTMFACTVFIQFCRLVLQFHPRYDFYFRCQHQCWPAPSCMNWTLLLLLFWDCCGYCACHVLPCATVDSVTEQCKLYHCNSWLHSCHGWCFCRPLSYGPCCMWLRGWCWACCTCCSCASLSPCAIYQVLASPSLAQAVLRGAGDSANGAESAAHTVPALLWAPVQVIKCYSH